MSGTFGPSINSSAFPMAKSENPIEAPWPWWWCHPLVPPVPQCPDLPDRDLSPGQWRMEMAGKPMVFPMENRWKTNGNKWENPWNLGKTNGNPMNLSIPTSTQMAKWQFWMLCYWVSDVIFTINGCSNNQARFFYDFLHQHPRSKQAHWRKQEELKTYVLPLAREQENTVSNALTEPKLGHK